MSTITVATNEGDAYSSQATDKIRITAPSSPDADYLESDICQISRHRQPVSLRMLPPNGAVLCTFISANDTGEGTMNNKGKHYVHFKHTRSPPNAAQSTSADITYLCCLHQFTLLNPADDVVLIESIMTVEQSLFFPWTPDSVVGLIYQLCMGIHNVTSQKS